MSIRAAIIGCGPGTPGKGGAHSFAYAHGYAYKACDGIELVAAATRTGKNLSDFKNEFPGIKGYADYREMLEREHPDIVSICAFPPTRMEMTMKALECGAHGVYIEKPMAMSMKDARTMLAEAEKRNARLFVNHQRRYGKPFQWLREAVVEEKIGALLGIDVIFPGKCLLNMGTHLTDAALFCLDGHKPLQVLGAVDASDAGDFQGTPVEKAVFALVSCDTGVRVTIEFGAMPCLDRPAIRANGTHGFAELHLDVKGEMKSIFRAHYKGESDITNPPTNEHFHHSEDATLYMKRAVRDILKALNSTSRTLIDAEEGIRSLEILLAIHESAKSGKLITLS
ncbi:MAG: Gfo/Idh/MocA family oxidoreductase [Victivallales bacterium]|nr:Gfo/Idh/MocA family oxidoreductase [Victivallales bacterium]